MACSGLVLLLIGVISSHLPEIQARPADFWCNSQARKNMGNKIEGLKKEMADCVGSDVLSSPVQLPCVWMHTAKWANETELGPDADDVGSSRMTTALTESVSGRQSGNKSSGLGELESVLNICRADEGDPGFIFTAGASALLLQQKHAEVVETLQMFRDGVQRAWNETRLPCQAPLLKELGHHMTNYLAIVNRLEIQDDQVIPAASTVQTCSSQTNLNKVLEQFKTLLKGKLERFAVDLQGTTCRAEHRTTAQ